VWRARNHRNHPENLGKQSEWEFDRTRKLLNKSAEIGRERIKCCGLRREAEMQKIHQEIIDLRRISREKLDELGQKSAGLVLRFDAKLRDGGQ
jgi:hypothetical protein